nr:TonB-dependent receptor [uncultured Desulfobacter sp.]
MGDITVTAQKTEENLRDVPVSVSVLDDLALEDLEIKNLGDLYNYIPNVSKTNAGVPSVRGISSNTGSLAIGLYVDGVPATGTVGFMSMMNGVERVEVLRGPQGTLYGKNTLAGVINVITKKPGNEREGEGVCRRGRDRLRKILSGQRQRIRDGCL